MPEENNHSSYAKSKSSELEELKQTRDKALIDWRNLPKDRKEDIIGQLFYVDCLNERIHALETPTRSNSHQC